MPSLPLELSEDEERAANLHSDQRWMFGGVVVALLMVALVCVIFWQAKRMQNEATLTSQSSTSPSAIPSQSPVAARIYSAKILNASGVTGLAGKYKKQLEAKDASWQVETGNSEIATGVVIKYQNQVIENSSLGIAIKEIWPKASEQIDESLKDSVEVIIGK